MAGMKRLLLAAGVAAWVGAAQNAQAAEWRVSHVDAPARVSAIETVDGQAQVNAGGLWYKIVLAGDKISLAFIDAAAQPTAPCPTPRSRPAKATSPAPGWPSRPRVTITASSATRSRPAAW